MLKRGISLESIKKMDDKEVSEYFSILSVFDEIESEQLNQK